jgi:hypothetical protein
MKSLSEILGGNEEEDKSNNNNNYSDRIQMKKLKKLK